MFPSGRRKKFTFIIESISCSEKKSAKGPTKKRKNVPESNVLGISYGEDFLEFQV